MADEGEEIDSTEQQKRRHIMIIQLISLIHHHQISVLESRSELKRTY